MMLPVPMSSGDHHAQAQEPARARGRTRAPGTLGAEAAKIWGSARRPCRQTAGRLGNVDGNFPGRPVAAASGGAGPGAARQNQLLRFFGASLPETVRLADFFGITEARLVLPSLGA